MSDPMNSTEVAVEQRLVGLYSATKALNELRRTAAGREVISRQQCVADIEIVRDQLSSLLDKIGGK